MPYSEFWKTNLPMNQIPKNLNILKEKLTAAFRIYLTTKLQKLVEYSKNLNLILKILDNIYVFKPMKWHQII